MLRELGARGYILQGEHYRRVPAGYDPQHPRAALLRHNALSVHLPALAPDVICSPQLVGVCMEHFTAVAPMNHWLATAVREADGVGPQLT